MAIRTNTNPIPLSLSPGLQEILVKNGMQAQVVGSSNGFALIVQGHDSPVLTYPITEKQLKALIDWGTNTANKKAYNTFASIVAADFDLPKDFVHARNANGRVAMGLHGYRIGVGEYGRIGGPGWRQPYPYHSMGWSFLGWTPRQQAGWHMRRIGGQLYYPGAPMVPTRPDGRMKPGELANGGYGFYYKGHTTAPVVQNQLDVLAQLQTVITPIQQPTRPTGPAIPYNTAIGSDVYFSNEKWQEVLSSHGLIVNAETHKLTVQSSAVDADLQYDLTDEEIKSLTSNSIEEYPVSERLKLLSNILKDDFSQPVTMAMLNSEKMIDIPLHPEVLADLNTQLNQQQQYFQQQANGQDLNNVVQQGNGQYQNLQLQPDYGLDRDLPKGGVLMNGNDLAYIDPEKGWFREGKHGREVSVEDIRVEPVEGEGGTMKYKMSAVIDGEVISHEIKQKDYEKFMAVDDFHRMKLFSKIFKEVDMKDRYPVNLGTKIAAALTAGLVVTGEILRGPRPIPPMYMDRVPGPPPPRVYFKPGVDTPADVAARQFDAMINNPNHRGPGMGQGM
ncbi:MAG: hypothetical protein J1F16_10440 [Muribaculaceae bacterium]|nr:hypothetical protein [Muribaculaceae bacterium]